MNEHDFGPDYHPRVDSARIRDTTPRELGSSLSEEYSESDDVMQQALAVDDASKREANAVPGLEEIGRGDFNAYVAARQSITGDFPVPGRVDQWLSGFQQLYDEDAPQTDFEVGLEKYISSVYSDNVGFDYDEIEVESVDETDVRLSVDLYYEPEADFLDRVSLPGELKVTGLLQNMDVS
ncbi:MAG: hypothetical protein ABEK10_01815 [Candidatus Nanosalina sp.]